VKVCTWDIEWYAQAVWQSQPPDIIKSSCKCKQIKVIMIVPCCALNFIIFWHIIVPHFFALCIEFSKMHLQLQFKTHTVISNKHDTVRSEITHICLLFHFISKRPARNANCIVTAIWKPENKLLFPLQMKYVGARHPFPQVVGKLLRNAKQKV